MTEKYFKNAFADSGDKETVPDDQVNTLVSYETGYTPEYELDPDTDPNGNFVGRQRMNQIFNDITVHCKQLQDFGYPSFIPDDGTGSPLSYQIGRIVESSGIYYKAIVNNTTTAPPSVEWEAVTLDDLIPVQATETLAGIAEIATTAETDAGVDDTRIITPLKLIQQFANSTADPGYQALPGGILIQFGTTLTINGNGTYVDSFALTFPNALLVAFANIQFDNGAAIVSSASTTSTIEGSAIDATTGTNVGNGLTIDWVAIGH